jgi:hypothetical protein
MIPRRLRLALSLTACAVVTTVAAPATAAARTDGPVAPHDLRRWAADTWASMDAMTVPRTGLTADNITAEGVRSAYTSPTNIGAYLWSTMAARDTRLISRKDARRRMARTLETLETLERSNGMFYNWYDPTTGARLTTWPTNGDPVYGFLSSVDNGWLAAALMMVRRAEPSLRSEASALLEDMNFGFYYDPAVGQLRGGYWPDGRPGATDPCPAVPAGFTCHHYGALNTEPRIASYIGIAAGDIPATHYYKLWRTFPASCDWGWQEMQPAGVTRTYLGVDVFEGHYSHNGLNIVPSWGGSMFEALMVPLLVPEETWGPRSWGVNHPLYVRAQVEHGLDEARYGYWGFSPSNNPEGGYREYGVDTLGLGAERLLLRSGADGHGSRVRRLPPGATGPGRLRARRRHPPRLVPRPPLRPGGGRRQPQAARALHSLRRVRRDGLLRRDRRHLRAGLAGLPGARPGHDHGRARQRADRRPPAPVLLPRRRRA